MKKTALYTTCFALVFLILPQALLANTEVTIKINTQNPGPVINKNIYGQFVEHLGRGVYEGIWVGEDSKIPNTEGYRKDVLKALKDIDVPLLRWPGGCFADEYHWRHGIGPRKNRAKTVNTSWGGVIDDNSFGTHEFMRLAELLDAEVYINGNLGTGTAQEMAAWLEYMTSPSQSTLANLRRKNGREKPWPVHYFAIGNEAWGCGGTMTPEYYANLFKHYATFLKSPKNNSPKIIASGGTNDWVNWTETLMTQVPEIFSMKMNAISHHYYTIPTGNWENKGRATEFPEEQWISTFQNTLKVEEYIQDNIKIMDKHDPEKKVGFYVDEWGTWYDTEKGDNPGFLFQQNTIRDALVAALNLNVFHKYAERVQMTIIAQMVNVLQAMILTDKEKMLLTPTYHVFKMYTPFQDATSLPLSLSDNPMYKLGDFSAPTISASAAIAKDGSVYLALTNINPREGVFVSLPNWRSAKGQLLTADSINSHNTFNDKDRVKPIKFKAKGKNKKLGIEVPAKSVIVVKLK